MSHGNARIILSQPQQQKHGRTNPAIPKYRVCTRRETSYRKLRHGWTRLVALCKLLDKQGINWNVMYDLEQEPPVALLEWHS